MIHEIHYWDTHGNEQVRYFNTLTKRFIAKSEVRYVDKVVKKHPNEIRLKEKLGITSKPTKKELPQDIVIKILFLYNDLCDSYCLDDNNPICKEDIKKCPISKHYDNFNYHKEMNWINLYEHDYSNLLRIRELLERRK